MNTDHFTITPSILYFGTPVALLSTENPDGSANLAPMSSIWSLGQSMVLGMSLGSRTAENLVRSGQVVVNVPGPELWTAVEVLGGLTGCFPVPGYKSARTRHCTDKFSAVGLTQEESELVHPPRVRECRIQIEAEVLRADADAGENFLVVEVRAVRVHASPEIVVPGTDHIDPHRWSPLIYNFRHYHGLGAELGHSSRSQTPTAPRPVHL